MAVDPHSPELDPTRALHQDALIAELASLRQTVEQLEARLQKVESRSGSAVAPAVAPPGPAPVHPAPPHPNAVPNRIDAPPVPASAGAQTGTGESADPQAVEPRLSAASFAAEDWLKWIGVGLIFLAMAFLVSTAISRGWIGPELQWVGAMLVGLALLGGAVRLNDERPNWSVAMGLGGVAIVGFTVAAGQSGLDLYSVPVATLFMFLTVAGGLAMGWWLDRASVAGLGIFLGVWIPTAMIVDSTPDLFTVTLGAIGLGVLIFAGVGVGIARRWTSLRLTTMIVTAPAFLLLSWEAGHGGGATGRAAALVLIALVGVLYWVVSSDFIPKETTSILGSIETRTATVLPLFIWLLVGVRFDMDQTAWIAAVLMAVVAAALALILRKLSFFNVATFSSHLVGAGLLLSVGLIGLIDGPVIPVLIAAQAVGFVWLALREDDPFVKGAAIVLGSSAAVIAAVGMAEAIEYGASFADHVAHLFVVLAAVAVAWLGWEHSWSRVVAVIAWIGAMGWIASVFSDLSQGQVLVSVLWMAMGAAAFVFGIRSRDTGVAHLGLATIGVTVIKLLTVDLGAVDTMWRAGLFLVVGLGLMRLGLMVSAIKPPPVDPYDLDTTMPPVPPVPTEPAPH